MRTDPRPRRRRDRDVDHAPAPRARARLGRALALVALLSACHRDERPAPCTCAPGNATKLTSGGAAITGDALLALLRRHARYVAEQRPGRDTKLLDDELRAAIGHYCQPCGDWVTDRATIDALYPLAHLDDATTATCLGLVLRDGTTTWGGARPPACRR